MIVHEHTAEPWRVTLVDTGIDTMLGGRIKRIQKYIDNKTFMLTYGDGVCNIDINKLYDCHKQKKKIATVTSTQPLGRFGAINLDSHDNVLTFEEKPKGDGDWINAGFFVLEPEIFDYIKGDDSIWEREPLENIARDNQLCTYKRRGFWMPMDTLRDKKKLDELWISGNAPWKIWE